AATPPGRTTGPWRAAPLPPSTRRTARAPAATGDHTRCAPASAHGSRCGERAMTRVTRQKEAGRAYLDLQNRARRERRNTQELLTLYVVERWLARLSRSAY